MQRSHFSKYLSRICSNILHFSQTLWNLYEGNQTQGVKTYYWRHTWNQRDVVILLGELPGVDLQNFRFSGSTLRLFWSYSRRSSVNLVTGWSFSSLRINPEHEIGNTSSLITGCGRYMWSSNCLMRPNFVVFFDLTDLALWLVPVQN